MYDRTVTFIIVGVLGVAAAALNAADNDHKEVSKHLKKWLLMKTAISFGSQLKMG